MAGINFIENEQYLPKLKFRNKMKTAKEVITEKVHQRKCTSISFLSASDVFECMETYANQFKYDYSKDCKCDSRIGETWCCNQCGLPVSK